jgi:hypothetical protein
MDSLSRRGKRSARNRFASNRATPAGTALGAAILHARGRNRMRPQGATTREFLGYAAPIYSTHHAE